MKKNFTLLAFAALGFAALTVTGCGPEPIPEPTPEPVKVESVALSATTATLEMGESVTLTATVLPANADDKSVTWSCEPASGVVSVEDGVVTALGEGTATVTATAADGSGKSAACTITVNPAPTASHISIAGDGFDFDEPLKIKYTEATSEAGFPVKVNIASARGIDKLLISIASDNAAFGGALQAVGLATEFDLANPDAALTAKLTALAGAPFYVALPYGEAVKGKTELSFDITPFIPLMFATTQQAGGGDFGASFTLKVADDTDVQSEITLNLSLIDDRGGVEITGQGFDLAEVQTINATALASTSVKMDVASTRGIDKMFVKITSSSPAIDRALQMVGLDSGFDLANPGELAGSLAGLSMTGITLPYGDAVKGQSLLTFDVSSFLPMLYQEAGECTVDFEITVGDDIGREVSKTLQLAFKNDSSNVYIVGLGFDIDQVQTINESTVASTDIRVDISSNRGIDQLLVKITSSSPTFSGLLTMAGLGSGFDLANPGEMAQALGMLSTMGITLPYGDAVKGQSLLTFDVSSFLPMLYQAAGESTVNFELTVVDDMGVEDTKTLKLAFVNDIPAAQ